MDEWDLLFYGFLTTYVLLFIIGALFYFKGNKQMAVVDNLNAAVAALDTSSQALSAAVDVIVAKPNNDVAVQGAADKIAGIASNIEALVAKLHTTV